MATWTLTTTTDRYAFDNGSDSTYVVFRHAFHQHVEIAMPWSSDSRGRTTPEQLADNEHKSRTLVTTLDTWTYDNGTNRVIVFYRHPGHLHGEEIQPWTPEITTPEDLRDMYAALFIKAGDTVVAV